MNRQLTLTAFVVLIAIFADMHVKTVRAECPAWLQALNPFGGTPVDVHSPEACENCGPGVCIDREKVEDCVCGEKKLYKTSVHKEYVAIPEVRYRWEMKCVTKEIPCDFCKPVCKTEEVDHQYQVEHWEKHDLPCGGEQYCKSCETQTEKLPVVNGCHAEPGKTTVKVHYLSCVKVPYTVYRQVEKEVGVRQPCFELVSVPVTRHVCCCREGMGCESCQEGPGLPNSTIDSESSPKELPMPEPAPQP